MEEKERYEFIDFEDRIELIDLENKSALDDADKIKNTLNQQDKRIKELEEELDDAKRDYIPKLEFGLQRANKMNKEIEQENLQLKQQLAITKKALEMAVNDKCFAEICIAESFIGKGAKVRVPKKEQCYLEQAKEMLENE